MKLLLTGAFQYRAEHFEAIRALGHQIVFVQDERIPLREQGIDPADIEGAVCNGLFLYNDFSAFEKLRYVQLISAGYDRVPAGLIDNGAIKLYNASGVYSMPMAEFALCGVLQLYKQSAVFRRNQQVHQWDKVRDLRELTDKTVCIIGCGSVGQACAKCFRAFDCYVLGVDIVPVDNTLFEKTYSFDALDEALAQSDVVILALPLTAQTQRLFDRERLLCCKKDAIFVNISRGGVVVERDLIDLLSKGYFLGAVLDVFEKEPLPQNSPLWDMENIILTPHNSFVGDKNSKRLFEIIMKNLQDES